MSSDEEDEFDKVLTKKLRKIKKKNSRKSNFDFYLVSRKSLIQKFRKSKNKEIRTLIFIGVISFSVIAFGILSMLDFQNISSEVVNLTQYKFYQSKIISQYQLCF